MENGSSYKGRGAGGMSGGGGGGSSMDDRRNPQRYGTRSQYGYVSVCVFFMGSKGRYMYY